MAINARAIYFYDDDRHLIKRGSLTQQDITHYTFVDEEATINQSDINVIQLAVAVPFASFSGGFPMITFRTAKGYVSNAISMSATNWFITEVAVETQYQVFYLTLSFVYQTYHAGVAAFMVGYLTNGAYVNLDLGTYTVQNGVDNFNELEVSLYEEVYTALYAVLTDLAERMTAIEVADFQQQVDDIKSGITIVAKATKDASGNVITTTYATKAEDALKELLANKKIVLTDNSDTYYPSQKAVKTAVDLKLNLAGGTMSGAIAMGTSKITGLGNGTAAGDVVNKGQLDLKLNLTGGTMSGAIAMGANKITGVVDGTDVQDVATMTNIAAHNVVANAHDNIRGAANGIAELDANGKVPLAQQYGALNDIQDAYIVGATPYAADWLSLTVGGAALTPDSGNWYHVITAGTYFGISYRWSGSAYVLVSSSLVLGETVNTAYRGDRGTTAYDHSQVATGNPHAVTFAQLGSKPTTLATFGITDAYTKTELNNGQLDTRYYTETEINTLLDALKTTYGLTETAVVTLADTQTVAMATVTGYSYLLLELQHTDGAHEIFGSVVIKPLTFTAAGDLVQINSWETGTQTSYGKLTYDGSTNFTFSASVAGDTLVVTGYKKDEVVAIGVTYDNAASGLAAVTVQAALDEIDADLDLVIAGTTAVTYNPAVSGLTAVTIKLAIDETVAKANANTVVNTANKTLLGEHDQRLDETEETLRKSLAGDTTANKTGTALIALGADVEPAPLKIQIDGMLLKSLNTFNLTTTTTNGVTATVSGNQITFSGTATAETTFTLVTGLTATNKAYVNVDYRSGTSDGVITLYNHETALNAVYGTDYSGVVTLGTTTITMVIANGATLTSLIYKVNINKVTELINRKQNSTLLNTTFDLMTDANIKLQMDEWHFNKTLPSTALKSAGFNKGITSYNKNLFNKVLYVTNYAYKIKVKPSTLYAWPASTAYKTYDINLVEVVSTTGTSVTTGAGTYYIAFTAVANVDTFQLEYTVATAYEPSVRSRMFVKGNANGYILPNKVADTVEFRDGKAYKVIRIASHTIIEANIAGLTTTGTNIDLVYTVASFPSNSVAQTSAIDGSILPIGYGPETTSVLATDDVVNIGKFFTIAGNRIYFVVAKGAYANLAAAQAAFAGTVIYYQLATPITTEIASSGVAYGYQFGTVQVDDIMLPQCAIYTTKASIANASYPIVAMESIIKLNTNGSQTSLAIADATKAEDSLSFTHTGLTAGDLVVFTYYHGDNVRGLVTITHYNHAPLIKTDFITPTDLTITTGAAKTIVLGNAAKLTVHPMLRQGKPTTNVPTLVDRGATTGFSMPIYSANEELFFNQHIIGRWNGSSDIEVCVIGYLSGAETADDDFALQLSWLNKSTASGIIPDTTNDVTVVTNIPDARKAAFSIYKVCFMIDWDLPAVDAVAYDLLCGRIRRIDVGGGNVEIDGEFVIIGVYLTFLVDKVFYRNV